MGVQVRNFFPQGVLQNHFGFGFDQWVPPNDDQYVVARTSLANNTSPANLTLSAKMTALGNVLPWPTRLWFVLHNRSTAQAGPPCSDQCDPRFDGADKLVMVITGRLNGVVQTETIDIIGITTITTPSGFQRSHQISVLFWDEITTIHCTPSGTFGTTTALTLSVGIGNSPSGLASNNRIAVLGPRVPALESADIFRRLIHPDGTSSPVGGGSTTNAAVDADTGLLNIPGKANRFTVNGGLAAIGTTTDLFTKTAHGYYDGQPFQVASYTDGLPTGLSEGVTYYVNLLGSADTWAPSTARQGTSFSVVLATPNVLALAAHTFTDGMSVVLHGNGVIPIGLSLQTRYFVINTVAGVSLQLSLTSGGAAVPFTVNPGGAASTSVVLLPLLAVVAAGTFADGENVRILLPDQDWRIARVVTADKLAAK